MLIITLFWIQIGSWNIMVDIIIWRVFFWNITSSILKWLSFKIFVQRLNNTIMLFTKLNLVKMLNVCVVYRIVLAVAFSMLIIGTLANARSRKYCGIFNHRFLFIGGILCFIHGLFTLPYYVSITAMRREEKRQQTLGPAVIRT